MSKTENKLTNNEIRVRRVQEIRSSGAAGAHGDRRTRRDRDRGNARRNAIRESE